MKDKFEKFLENNNALGAFYKNIKTPEVSLISHWYEISHLPPESWINYPFDWYLSDEGLTYWEDVNEKWKNFCKYEQVKSEFINFLVKHKAYSLYMRNLGYKRIQGISWDSFSDYDNAFDIDFVDESNFLCMAFTWADDQSFPWYELNILWTYYLRKEVL